MSQLITDAPDTSNVVDARSSDPFLDAKMGIFSVDVGEVIEVLANDSRLDEVLPVWAGKVGHEYLGHMDVNGCEHIFMRRGK